MARATKTATMTAAWHVWRSSRLPGSPGIGERFAALPRMLGAAMTGRYHGTSYGRLTALGLALAYIVSPIDLIPEGIFLVFGLVDDVGVAAWLASAVLVETDRFLQWERHEANTVPGQVL